MKYGMHVLMAIMLAAVILSCDERKVAGGHTIRESLISKGFIDDETYRVVCRGYPLEGATGVKSGESSRRAALLNAYYFVRGEFGDRVNPEREGRAEKIEPLDDHTVLHFVVKKKKLRSLLLTPAEKERIRQELERARQEREAKQSQEDGDTGSSGTADGPVTE